MTASEKCKAAGLKNLAELIRLSPVPKQTLLDWYHKKTEWFVMAINDVKQRVDDDN